jgi:hypothetical protein
MYRSFAATFAISLLIYGADAQTFLVSDSSVQVNDPGGYPYGVDINVNFTSSWVREYGVSYNGSGKLLSVGAFSSNGTTLSYDFIGGNTSSYSAWQAPWMTFLPSGNVGISTLTPQELLDVNGNPVFGTSTERLSLGSGSLGFNRRVATGAIYSSSSYAYQVQHTGSTTASSDYLAFQVFNPSGTQISTTALVVNGSGQVGVNTTNIPASYQFAVNGSILATAVAVQLYTAWPDFVFEGNYSLPSLSDVKEYIEQHHHLMNIPTGKEIEINGLDLGAMQKAQMQKIEELTLYAIDADKRISKEKDLITQQQNLLVRMQAQLNSQQQEIDQLKRRP